MKPTGLFPSQNYTTTDFSMSIQDAGTTLTNSQLQQHFSISDLLYKKHDNNTDYVFIGEVVTIGNSLNFDLTFSETISSSSEIFIRSIQNHVSIQQSTTVNIQASREIYLKIEHCSTSSNTQTTQNTENTQDTNVSSCVSCTNFSNSTIDITYKSIPIR